MFTKEDLIKYLIKIDRKHYEAIKNHADSRKYKRLFKHYLRIYNNTFGKMSDKQLVNIHNEACMQVFGNLSPIVTDEIYSFDPNSFLNSCAQF